MDAGEEYEIDQPNNNNDGVNGLLLAVQQHGVSEDGGQIGAPVNGTNYFCAPNNVMTETDYRDDELDFASYSTDEVATNRDTNFTEFYADQTTPGVSYNHQVNTIGHGHMPFLSEDLRISRLLRRLSLESNRNTAAELCRKLSIAVRNPANAPYICRSFDILFDNMVSIVTQCPAECVEQTSEILGVMGYISRQDFGTYKASLEKAYTNKSLRRCLMIALRTTLSCDAVNMSLKCYSESILNMLKEYLENAEEAENFMAISETICEFSKHYQQSFQKQFTDIVDIVIGWHLETDQPLYLKRHCAKTLQQFADYFLKEKDFTLGLLGQFNEDIEACGEDIQVTELSLQTKQQTEARVGAFIGAFTSLVLAMISRGIGPNKLSASADQLHEAKRIVNDVSKHCFQAVAFISEETVINLNEFYCVIASYDKSVENLCYLEEIMELQLKYLHTFKESQVSSFLYMVLVVVQQYRTQLPLSFVTLIMRNTNGPLRELRINSGTKNYTMLLKIYHEILFIKNVPLLQEAYRHILQDINATMDCLKMSQSNPNASIRGELTLSFYLASLSVLSCQTSSIIGMYALNPSILELFITSCQAANEELWSKYPSLHKALLAVIVEHSTKNHNFHRSSRLFGSKLDSPTSENFATILKFLAVLFRWYVSAPILEWLQGLLEQCKEHYKTLNTNPDFLQICLNVRNLSLNNPKLCAKTISSILKFPKLPDYILNGYKDIVLCTVSNRDENLLDSCGTHLALLPLQHSCSSEHTLQYLSRKRDYNRAALHWYKSTPLFFTLRPKYFKAFIETLEPGSKNNESLYPVLLERNYVCLNRDRVEEYFYAIRGDSELLQHHLEYEAARCCVQQKLRTSLGKPQETFLAIEAIIMKYARYLAEKETMPASYNTCNHVMMLHQKCHNLVGFLECLEKHIYNAAEGTAFAMLPAEKPAKTFFRVNITTCNEWLKRIRTAVNLIALQCMVPEIVVRYSETMLKSEAILSNPSLRDRTVASMVWALFLCGEPDTLQGLLMWLKAKQMSDYEWIQFVAEHANGHYEKAALGYLSVLRGKNLIKMDSFVREFLQKQFMQCLYHTSMWSDAVTAKDHQYETVSNYFSNRIKELDAKLNSRTCTTGEDQLLTALLGLTTWKEVSKVKPIDQLESFSSQEILNATRESCLRYALCDTDRKVDAVPLKTCIQKSMRNILIQGHLPGTYNHVLNELVLLNQVAYKLEHCEQLLVGSGSSLSPIDLNSALNWTLIMGGTITEQNAELLLTMASKARLGNNIDYCQALLERFFQKKSEAKSLSQIIGQLQHNKMHIDHNDSHMTLAVVELIKYMQAKATSPYNALEVGAAYCCNLIQAHSDPQLRLPDSVLSAFLTMSDWLCTFRSHHPNIASGPQMQKLQSKLPDMTFCSPSDQSKCHVLSPLDQTVGKLLNAATLCKSDSGEAWSAFGNWCYRWGKKLMESTAADDQGPEGRENKLTNLNIPLRKLLGDDVTDEGIAELLELLNTHVGSSASREGAEDAESQKYQLLEVELRRLGVTSQEQFSVLVNTWRKTNSNIYLFYEEATRAYFKYLSIESTATQSNESDTTHSQRENFAFVNITLRLLRLIVKHSHRLQGILEEGLRNTPLRPWKVIVPQLFSRLNHHELYVRQSVTDLLCRLAVIQPQMIIFPAVVGAQQEKKNNEKSDCQMQLTHCFVALLNTLFEQSPEEVLQVQLLVKELKRITLLWEEYWLQSLSHLYAEYSHIYTMLEAELNKRPGSAVVLASCKIFRQHLLADFKKIVCATANEPETSYERCFQERFGASIQDVMNCLTKEVEYPRPLDFWQKIRQLYSLFQQKPIRGSFSSLKIADISPVLAHMENTRIAMPGVDTNDQPAVHIKSVESTILILPTKTKPKKLALKGTDGQKYTYLFKGQEDLHLDERIMQFLSIANLMMSRSNGPVYQKDSFKAHHYSVIPLGSQSGLISWVEQCTPLFVIYKKWQQREAALQQQQKEQQKNTSRGAEADAHSQNNANTLRPSELFYNKLTPLLTEHGLKITDPRWQWPISVLKQVLEDLCKETPSDLVAKEIWCFSNNVVEWRMSVRRYTMSLAVMSIIGYVIGLGDRHLDNILIKLGTGEIVHIDYNVCFEKGKTLRVPENVPFRMTQNLRDTLGLVGTEGPFRLACSHVLKILRKERETLLTLLEAFVYDPLVDWAVSDDGDATILRRTSALTAAALITSVLSSKDYHPNQEDVSKIPKSSIEITQQALTAKITEVNSAWHNYRNDLDMQLLRMVDHGRTLLDVQKQMQQLESQQINFTKQQAMVRDLTALGPARGSHALNTVSQRYKAYKNALDSYLCTQQLVQQTVMDLELVLRTYYDVLLQPAGINNIVTDPSGNVEAISAINEFDFLADQVSDNGWDCIYAQGSLAKQELGRCFLQIRRSVSECRELLLFYSLVMQFFPRCRLKQSPLIKYKGIYEKLLNTGKMFSLKYATGSQCTELKNTDACQEYLEQLHEIYVSLNTNLSQAQSTLCGLQQRAVEYANAASESMTRIPDGQLILHSIIRQIQEASESFSSGECKCDSLLLDDNLVFLESVVQFVARFSNSFPSLECPPITMLYIRSMKALCILADSFEYVCETIVCFFMAENENPPQEVSVIDLVTEKLKPDFNRFVASAQRLQESLCRMQELHSHSAHEGIMSSWTTNILELFTTCRDSCIAKLVSYIHSAVVSLNMDDSKNAYDIRRIRTIIYDALLTIKRTLFDPFVACVIQAVTLRISDMLPPIDEANADAVIEMKEVCHNVYLAVENEFQIRSAKFLVRRCSYRLEHHRIFTTAYCWVNESYIANSAFENKAYIKPKQTLLSSLHSVSQVMKICCSSMEQVQLNLEGHRQSVKALITTCTPALEGTENMTSFDNAAFASNQLYTFFKNISSLLAEYSAVVLQVEVSGGHEPFDTLVKQYNDARCKLENCEALVSEVERNLVQLLDPEGNIDQCWIENISGLLDEMIFAAQRSLSNLEINEQQAIQVLRDDGHKLQVLVDSPLRLEIRHLLKSIAKWGRPAWKLNSYVRNVQQSLKQMQSNVNSLQQLVPRDSESIAVSQMEASIEEVVRTCDMASSIFEVLMQRCAKPNAVQMPPIHCENVEDSNSKEVLHSQLGEQKRNAYAVSVWKRIRIKLEGRDPDPSRRMSVAEQVDHIINEATNVDNLATLYEGWTPWV